jgi:hypothetical protein
MPDATGSSSARKKRKSNTSDAPVVRASTSETGSTFSRDSSEEYNPTSQTRFGRQTQKPTGINDTFAMSASPAMKLSRNNSAVNANSQSPATAKTHPKIKRRVYRGREQFALCEHCLRGYGPPGNVIVFCDACNKCWHQRCHEPQVSKQIVSDSKAEWYCAECDRILHGKKKDRKTPGKAALQNVVATPQTEPSPKYAGPLVGGRYLPPEQRIAYLKTQTKEQLIHLIIQGTNLAPELPMFQMLATPIPVVPMPQAQFTSSYVTPVSKPPANSKTAGGGDEEIDEGYDGYYDEHAALYPKPGQGVQLPPESEDLHMLLEGKESRTFSHWVSGTAGPMFAGNANVR